MEDGLSVNYQRRSVAQRALRHNSTHRRLSLLALGCTKEYIVQKLTLSWGKRADPGPLPSSHSPTTSVLQLTEMKGHDTSHHALACFGGAGPQHACAIARALKMRKCPLLVLFMRVHAYQKPARPVPTFFEADSQSGLLLLTT